MKLKILYKKAIVTPWLLHACKSFTFLLLSFSLFLFAAETAKNILVVTLLWFTEYLPSSNSISGYDIRTNREADRRDESMSASFLAIWLRNPKK